jgi:hypothetical protein
MMFSTGLIGELPIRTYFETQDRRIYAVREVLTQKQRESVRHEWYAVTKWRQE